MQDHLKKALAKEFGLQELQKELAHGAMSERTAMYVVLNVLPCILHLKNQFGLKILTWLLRISLSRAKARLIEGIGSTHQDRIKNYLKKVELICNTLVWGTKDFPVHWTCPYDPKEQNFSTISLNNKGHAWQFI
jgi:hypothetical protein